MQCLTSWSSYTRSEFGSRKKFILTCIGFNYDTSWLLLILLLGHQYVLLPFFLNLDRRPSSGKGFSMARPKPSKLSYSWSIPRLPHVKHSACLGREARTAGLYWCGASFPEVSIISGWSLQLPQAGPQPQFETPVPMTPHYPMGLTDPETSACLTILVDKFSFSIRLTDISPSPDRRPHQWARLVSSFVLNGHGPFLSHVKRFRIWRSKCCSFNGTVRQAVYHVLTYRLLHRDIRVYDLALINL